MVGADSPRRTTQPPNHPSGDLKVAATSSLESERPIGSSLRQAGVGGPQARGRPMGRPYMAFPVAGLEPCPTFALRVALAVQLFEAGLGLTDGGAEGAAGHEGGFGFDAGGEQVAPE